LIWGKIKKPTLRREKREERGDQKSIGVGGGAERASLYFMKVGGLALHPGEDQIIVFVLGRKRDWVPSQ